MHVEEAFLLSPLSLHGLVTPVFPFLTNILPMATFAALILKRQHGPSLYITQGL